MNNRENAIKWWESLSYLKKYHFMIACKDDIIGYPDRNPSSLTGREIEILYVYSLSDKQEA